MPSKIIPGEMILEGSIPDGQLVNAPKKEFTDLDDTPANYTASADKVLVVNGTPDGIEFTDSPVLAELQVTGKIYSGVLTITASSDVTNVSGINTLFINPSGAVVLGGFVGGVAGQVLFVSAIANGQDITLEHVEGIGGATQDVYLHSGIDETLSTEFGGWTLTCNGTNWYDTSHAKHV